MEDSEGQPPTLKVEAAGAVLQGDWRAQSFMNARRTRTLQRALGRAADHGQSTWDLNGIRLDHVGAQLLWNAWGRRLPESVRLTDAQRDLFNRLAEFSADNAPAEPSPGDNVVTRVGLSVFAFFGHALDVVRLIGQFTLDLLRLLKSPARGPWRDFAGHIYRMGANALPITALVGLLIGVVLAYLTSQQLRAFGAQSFIVDILGLSVIRELGPILAAILVAGRSGSAITAQIGVMRLTEELDAMRVLGIPLGFRLVMPRMLALALVMPLISIWTSVLALVGGIFVANFSLDISPGFFLTQLPQAVDIGNVWLNIGKSCVFGLTIALVGCHFGMRVKPDTESLGAGTTASVVTSITLVILIDALFAVLFKDVGI